MPPGIPKLTSTPCLFNSSITISEPSFCTVRALLDVCEVSRKIQPAAAFLRLRFPLVFFQFRSGQNHIPHAASGRHHGKDVFLFADATIDDDRFPAFSRLAPDPPSNERVCR